MSLLHRSILRMYVFNKVRRFSFPCPIVMTQSLSIATVNAVFASTVTLLIATVASMIAHTEATDPTPARPWNAS